MNTQRNRHTGRINAAKAQILEKGERVIVGDKPYTRIQTGMRVVTKEGREYTWKPKDSNKVPTDIAFAVPVFTYVKGAL